MSCKASDFVGIAERILALEDTEIAWRIATGRAYYGAFHCCHDLIQRHPTAMIDESLPTHERIYKAVNVMPNSAMGAMDLKRLAYKAKNIRDLRVDADYSLAMDFRRELAEQALESAKIVLQLYDQFCVTHQLS